MYHASAIKSQSIQQTLGLGEAVLSFLFVLLD